MKTAIYIEHGFTQVVLTPENETERKYIEPLKQGCELDVFRGEFYPCQGGWTRQKDGDESVILKIKKG